MAQSQENILLPDFYNYLEVVIYNGPPNTIYGKYYGRVTSGNELSIINALKECYYRNALFRNIVNPSDEVILCYLSEFSINKLKDVKLDPSKSLIQKSILLNSSNFKDYKSIFNEKEIMEFLEQGINIYQDIDDLTLEMSKLVVLKGTCLMNNLLKYIKYWDNDLINMIVNNKYIVSNFNIIPNISLDQIVKAVYINPLRLKYFTDIILDQDVYIKAFDINSKCIEYIPYEFQNDHMYTHLKINDLLSIKFSKDKTQDDFDRLISKYSGHISYVPKEFQTLQMCKKCVEDYNRNLEYCYFVDNEMLNSIFKAKFNIHVPKKDRYNFIVNFNEDALIRIIKVKCSLLRILPEDKQTDRLIREILQFNGYALQHVINPTKEHIDIALLNEPKAIKYVKTSI